MAIVLGAMRAFPDAAFLGITHSSSFLSYTFFIFIFIRLARSSNDDVLLSIDPPTFFRCVSISTYIDSTYPSELVGWSVRQLLTLSNFYPAVSLYRYRASKDHGILETISGKNFLT